MRKKGMIRMVPLLIVSFLFAASAQAEVNTSYGVDFRLRQETWDNVFDMNLSDVPSAAPFAVRDENFLRLKTSPWFRADIDKKYGFFLKLTNEARYFMDSNTPSLVGLNKDEVVIDNLYVSAKSPADIPVDVTIGRQDLMNYGEGFLIMDGTPGDGSRTWYFDAAKTVLKFGDTSTLDLIWITDQFNDRALPSLYSEPKRTLNTTDEQAAVAYGRLKIGGNADLEPYYIYKREQATAVPFPSDNSALKLNTVGARVVYPLADGWKLRGQYARQFGRYDNGNDRVGDGGYFYISRTYENVALKPSFDIGYIYLSGDNPNTPKVESWDPLFARYPSPWFYSELYYLSYKQETGIYGYWSNLQVYRANFKFALDDATGLDLAYNLLRANENTFAPAFAPSNIFSDSGKNRGSLIQAQLSHTFSKTVDGYLRIEDFVPGNYYKDTNRSNATFVRWQLQWKI